MIYNVREEKLKIQHIRMEYITFGKGKNPLVMIQGLNTRGIKGAGFGLAYMYRRFAKEYKVYLFDRREEVREDITVRELASDIAAAMDALHLTKADVFAVSQGGMIGQYLAIDRPDLVNKLVLAMTLSRNNEIVKTVIQDWIAMTKQNEMKKLVEDMTQKMYSEEYGKRYKFLLPVLTVLQKPKDVPRFIRLANACLTCNTYEELDKIKCPVFVIGGRQDKVVGGKASEEIAEKIGCEIYLYENLGHAAYEEAKDFNERVWNFFQKAD